MRDYICFPVKLREPALHRLAWNPVQPGKLDLQGLLGIGADQLIRIHKRGHLRPKIIYPAVRPVCGNLLNG